MIIYCLLPMHHITMLAVCSYSLSLSLSLFVSPITKTLT